MSIAADYIKAMVAGHINECIRIEQKYDLYGYTPELVSVGLRAVDDGRNPIEAVDAYLDDIDGDDAL